MEAVSDLQVLDLTGSSEISLMIHALECQCLLFLRPHPPKYYQLLFKCWCRVLYRESIDLNMNLWIMENKGCRGTGVPFLCRIRRKLL
jgi:hypothetical protein